MNPSGRWTFGLGSAMLLLTGLAVLFGALKNFPTLAYLFNVSLIFAAPAYFILVFDALAQGKFRPRPPVLRASAAERRATLDAPTGTCAARRRTFGLRSTFALLTLLAVFFALLKNVPSVWEHLGQLLLVSVEVVLSVLVLVALAKSKLRPAAPRAKSTPHDPSKSP